MGEDTTTVRGYLRPVAASKCENSAIHVDFEGQAN